MCFGTAGGGHDGVDLLGELEQDSATAVTIHHGGGAAKVEVDARCAEGGGKGGIFREANRVAPQQLHAHRHACTGATTVSQFRYGAEEGSFGEQMIGDPHKFCHAQVDAAEPRQDVAQAMIGNAFHWSEYQAHVF